ncbi:MAG: DUF1579 domain-containing protein [Planctomycetaceae bacterium]
MLPRQMSAAVLCLAFTLPVCAQDVPTPGPEHEMLKTMIGTWDAVTKLEGAAPSKAVATYKMECSGLWLTSNFEGDFEGIRFQGKGLDSYDAKKKKFIGVWVDSMQTTPMIFEGDHDKATRTTTMFSDYPGPDGQPARWKSVSTMPDNDHHTFKLYLCGKAGAADALYMTIEYTRRK